MTFVMIFIFPQYNHYSCWYKRHMSFIGLPLPQKRFDSAQQQTTDYQCQWQRDDVDEYDTTPHQSDSATGAPLYKHKTALLMYKCMHGLAPSYPVASCQPSSYCAGRSNLRSANLYQLQVPRTRTCYSDQSLLVNGPAVRNSLPVELRSPKMSLDILNR